MTSNRYMRDGIVKNKLLEQFPYFIKGIISQTDSYTRVKNKDFSLLYIIKLLDCIQTEEKRYLALHRESGIIMKKTFMRYLDLGVYFKFIHKTKQAKNRAVYSITEKGKIFLDLFLMD